MTKKIIMLVYNHFENDSRVLKEAQSLADNNYEVHIFAIWKNGLEKEKILSKNVFLTRVKFKPLHIKLVGERNFKKLKNLIYRTPKSIDSRDNSTESKEETQDISKNQEIANSKPKIQMGFLKFFLSSINKILNYKGFYSDVKIAIKSKNLNADFIHSHDLNTLPLGAKIARSHKAKLIYDSHELYIHRNKPYITPKWFQSIQKRIEQKNIRKCDAVITVSKSIVDYLEKTYKIPTPHLIMNAPFKKKIEPLSDKNNLKSLLNISNDKTLLIYTGVISFNRGLDKVIESMKYIDDAFLVLLGNGTDNYKIYLQSVAEKYNVIDKFSFYGPVPSFQVTSFVQSADLGIAPIENVCLSYYFCAPNKIFEYIQGGIPVVASKFPDMEMVITENKIGDFFNPNSPEDIAKSINNIIDNKDIYNECKNNVESIIDKYKWENEEKKLIALYQDLN